MDGFYIIFTLYLIFFGLILFSAEYEILIIMKYVEFLLSESGKGLFLIFIGLLLFDERRMVDLVASLVVSMIGILNLAAACSRASCCFGSRESLERAAASSY